MKKYRKIWCLITLAFLFILVPLTISADYTESSVSFPVPEEIRPYLPDGAEQTETVDFAGDYSFSYFWKTGWGLFLAAVPEAASSFAVLLGLLLIAACLRAVMETLAMPALRTALELTSLLCVCTAFYSVTENLFSFAETFLTSISSFLTALVPVMAGLLVGSGHITSASVLGGVMAVALSVLERICVGVMFPLIRISLAVAAVSALFGESGMASVIPMLKKIIAFIFGFVTLCLSAVVAFQGIIAKSMDSLTMKGVKFAIGAFVPLVGSAVNEAVSTVAGGLSAIRAATGVLGAVSVVLLAALPLAKVLAHKFFLEILSVCAGVLGLMLEGKVVSEIASFFGYVAAIMAISAVFFILSLSLMASISV